MSFYSFNDSSISHSLQPVTKGHITSKCLAYKASQDPERFITGIIRRCRMFDEKINAIFLSCAPCLVLSSQINLLNNTIPAPRGHVLGGSSSISPTLCFFFSSPLLLIKFADGMWYTRGSSADYDRWANITGDQGWLWDELQNYFEKVGAFMTIQCSIPDPYLLTRVKALFLRQTIIIFLASMTQVYTELRGH